MKAELVLLPLARPQYVSVVEGFISSLAWSIFEVDNKIWGQSKKPGLRYRKGNDSRPHKNLNIVYTEPFGESRAIFGQALVKNGLKSVSNGTVLADAALNSIVGIKVEKGKFQPASPLSPHLALLQNMEGIHGSSNPPPTADILETIFEMGGRLHGDETAAELWLKSAKNRMDLDPMVAAIDLSVGEVVFCNSAQEKIVKRTSKGLDWQEIVKDSPFTWFYDSWKTLNSEEWVSALPARVWTDWAITVLRTGFGLAYLWESAWYESLAQRIVQGAEFGLQDVKFGMAPTLPWKSSRTTAEIRDLASKLKSRSLKAVSIRRILEGWLRQDDRDIMDLDEAIQLMLQDVSLREQLEVALSPDGRSPGDQFWEAIRYSLIVRNSTGKSADYYGLLKPSGTRYLFADPGAEWVSVVASLTCETPGGETSLGEVLKSMAAAGAKPDQHDLLNFLERAGLARGSADADQGVTVSSAY